MNKLLKNNDFAYVFSMTSILVVGVAHLYYGSMSADGRYSSFFSLGIIYCTIPGLLMTFSISSNHLLDTLWIICLIVGPIHFIKNEGWMKGLLGIGGFFIVWYMVLGLTVLMDKKKEFRQVVSFLMAVMGMEETVNLMRSKKVELTESQRRQF